MGRERARCGGIIQSFTLMEQAEDMSDRPDPVFTINTSESGVDPHLFQAILHAATVLIDCDCDIVARSAWA